MGENKLQLVNGVGGLCHRKQIEYDVKKIGLTLSDKLPPNWAIGSSQWTNPIEPRILKYNIKIIKNASLQNLNAYTKPFTS